MSFTFFWKPHQENGDFSQWSTHSFELHDFPFANEGETVLFDNAEQAMMVAKANTFNDYDIIPEMMSTDNPLEIKKLGRKVKNFDKMVWDKVARDIVYKINLAKFNQNTQLRDQLLKTEDSIIVEASPMDRIWGIGLSVKNPKSLDQTQWRGQNLLGKALMQVRDTIRNSS